MAHLAAEAARALQPRATDTEVAPLCAEAAEVTSCGKCQQVHPGCGGGEGCQRRTEAAKD